MKITARTTKAASSFGAPDLEGFWVSRELCGLGSGFVSGCGCGAFSGSGFGFGGASAGLSSGFFSSVGTSALIGRFGITGETYRGAPRREE
jgi:hypothetical protein